MLLAVVGFVSLRQMTVGYDCGGLSLEGLGLDLELWGFDGRWELGPGEGRERIFGMVFVSSRQLSSWLWGGTGWS